MKHYLGSMNGPSRLSIIDNLVRLSFLCIIGIIIFLFFFHYSFSKSLQLEKRKQIKLLSETGLGILKHFHQLELSGELNSEKALTSALNVFKSISYGTDGYFWINNVQGVMLMHPHTPEWVGINMTMWTDINGKYAFKEIIHTAKNGGGWAEYHWPKPGKQEQSAKISYSVYFPHWDLVLGTGIYLHDMKKNILSNVLQASGFFIICFTCFIILTILTAIFFIKELDSLAVRDHLTGLFTKRYFKETLPLILKKFNREKSQILAAIFIDIDHFKKINDQYGHSFGDKVLQSIASMIQNNTRPDDLCIRYGGEEFVIVGFFTHKTAIVTLCERIRTKASKLNFTNRYAEFNVTLSAGIAVYEDGEPFENTLSRADQKLYQAKESGRNRVIV